MTPEQRQRALIGFTTPGIPAPAKTPEPEFDLPLALSEGWELTREGRIRTYDRRIFPTDLDAYNFIRNSDDPNHQIALQMQLQSDKDMLDDDEKN